jgi:hypothetical protein
MRLKPGVRAEVVANHLRDAIQAPRNTSLVHDLDPVPYVAWAQRVGRLLQDSFTDVPLERVYTERFWRVQSPTTLRRAEALSQEVELQLAWLTTVLETITAMAARFSQRPDSIAVLDTNVLLHHLPLKDVDWPKVVGHKQVSLVVPRRVVAEMDARKYVGTKGGDRARKRIALLAGNVHPDTDEVRPGVEVEIIGPVDLDPDAGRRPAIPADEEIIETAEALVSYAGSNSVCVVTGDLAMQMLAASRGLDVRRMPEDTIQPVGVERGEDSARRSGP